MSRLTMDRVVVSGQWSVASGQKLETSGRPCLPFRHLVTLSPCHLVSRSAFTMAEVIFAVMILGIGLILLAAAFPVGIKQNEKTQDATNAALIAQHAMDQLTKVPAAGVVPGRTDWSPTLVSLYDRSMPMDRYGDQSASSPVPGKALAMAFLDGSMSAQPDLRVKLLYPGTLYHDDLNAGPPTNPTMADDCPQHQTMLGSAAYDTSSAAPPVRLPIPFVRLWGFRLDAGNWHENVQWAYPADRRYYWYAFYRQMNEGVYPHPTKGMAPWTDNSNRLLDAVQLDHMTRRTYRVLVVACKVSKQFSVRYPLSAPTKTLNLTQIEPPSFFQNRYGIDPTVTPDVCMQQWVTRNGPYDTDLAPIRVPTRYDDDGAADPGIRFDATRTWISDTGAGGPIATMIRSGKIRRGGILIDAWGNIYQIVDVTDTAVRIDSPLPLLPATYGYGDIRDVLPLWFNPNAIAVFPMIVTKQADMP